MKYKTIFISDVHLGSRGCQADLLFNFLSHNQADNLYLVGDILDIWALKRELYWPQSHTNVLKQILSASKKGTKIYYILGNHDKEFRRFLNLELQFGNISIHNQLPYISGEGKKYLVDEKTYNKTYVWLVDEDNEPYGRRRTLGGIKNKEVIKLT